ncbi:Tetratricopeptide repeat-containing protein [Desulfonatronum thiosulfatophilum]|uniref:Tetratricopeptide repeat-containing protein n=1 Tax=Desulfonatronum thiosulfatophilum TaxID=617002 RepID=A0A1G6C0Q9_9BACT|nr:hypothetical protein [Desulfonatronum thiosulfatophilum]SDB26460.1 Tetratricopeptide repeat-containing protein [Desulfonatronum thiosulfatophilum]
MPTSAPAQVFCTPDKTNCWRAHLFPLLLVFIILSIIYANSFQGTWIFDDEPNIVANPNVHLKILDWESIKGTFYGIHGNRIDRPLAFLSFGLNYYFHGLDTWSYHLVNFIIHCLASLFLYLFIFQTLHLPRLREKYAQHAGSIALLATLLWATHPIHVTSVTYIVQRMASMAAMFFIMAMFFYLMGRITPRLWSKIGWFSLCFLSGFLSLSSKENAVMLPVVLYLFDLLLIQGVNRQTIKRHLLYGAFPLTFLGVMAFVLTSPTNILAGYSNREFTLTERLLTQPRILLFYLSLLIYPMTDRFTLIYEVQLSKSLFTPWTTLPVILFWITWAGLGVYLVKRLPLIAYCLLFFIVNHLIEGSFIPLELIYEHRNYLPSMTIFLMISIALIIFIRDFTHKRLLHVLTVALIWITIAGQGFSVIQRNTLFKHPFYLWSDNVAKSPGMSRVYTNLAHEYALLGLYEDFKELNYAAIKSDRHHRLTLRAVPFNNLGYYYLQNAGDPLMAIEMFEKALYEDPAYWRSRLGLILALIQSGEVERAGNISLETLATTSHSDKFHSLNALALLKLEDYQSAVKEGLKVISVDTDNSIALKVLGEAYMQLGEYHNSQSYWQKYAEINANDLEPLLALLYLAYILDDEDKLRLNTMRILSLKQDKTWERFFSQYNRVGEMDILIFSVSPWELFHLIRNGLELEIKYEFSREYS